MKHIIKKLLRENLLGETMLTSKNLPIETALFQKDNRISLVLYDPMTNKSYGVISASLRGQNFDVDKVAAEDGFGPYIYEMAMMMASTKGKGLMPARKGDVRSEALNVWVKFYDRPDVNKTNIAPFDASGKWNPEFSVALYTGSNDTFENPEEYEEWLSEINPETQELIKKYNTVYSMQPNDDFKEMLGRGQNYIKKGFNPIKAFKSGSDLFFSKYD